MALTEHTACSVQHVPELVTTEFYICQLQCEKVCVFEDKDSASPTVTHLTRNTAGSFLTSWML